MEQSPVDVLAAVKKLVYIFCGACILSWVFILLSNITINIPAISGIMGFGVFAALALPCMMVFVFKSDDLIIDLGPAFYKSESRIGNFIYEKWEHDYESEMTEGLLWTVLKAALIAYGYNEENDYWFSFEENDLQQARAQADRLLGIFAE